MTHRNRILERILKKNFMGVIVPIRDIIQKKMNLFDAAADIEMVNTDSNKSRITFDYGDSCYSFDIIYDLKKENNTTYYIVKSIV